MIHAQLDLLATRILAGEAVPAQLHAGTPSGEADLTGRAQVPGGGRDPGPSPIYPAWLPETLPELGAVLAVAADRVVDREGATTLFGFVHRQFFTHRPGWMTDANAADAIAIVIDSLLIGVKRKPADAAAESVCCAVDIARATGVGFPATAHDQIGETVDRTGQRRSGHLEQVLVEMASVGPSRFGEHPAACRALIDAATRPALLVYSPRGLPASVPPHLAHLLQRRSRRSGGPAVAAAHAGLDGRLPLTPA